MADGATGAAGRKPLATLWNPGDPPPKQSCLLPRGDMAACPREAPRLPPCPRAADPASGFSFPFFFQQKNTPTNP